MTACMLCGSELWADGSPNLWTEARAKEAEQEAATQASELATLRRRVAQIDSLLSAIHDTAIHTARIGEDIEPLWLSSRMKEVRALSAPLPPGRNEG